MKRALVAAAVGALGALGTAGLMAAAPAQADCSTPVPDPGPPPVVNPDFTPPLTPARVVCVTNEQISEFLRTASPDYNLRVLVNGTTDDPGLGLKNQPATFVSSVGDFLNGPRSPDPAPDPAP